MYLNEEMIVLHVIPHKTGAVVLHVIGEVHGKMTVYVRGVGGNKSKTRLMIHPGAVLEMTYKYQSNKEMQTGGSLRRVIFYKNIPGDVLRSSLVMFIAEVVLKTTTDGEAQKDQYDLIKTTLELTDLSDDFGNLHLFFLGGWIKLLGIDPVQRPTIHSRIDLFDGSWSEKSTGAVHQLDYDLSALFSGVLGMNLDELLKLKISRKEKQKLLRAFVDYLCNQLSVNRKIESLEILELIFDEI